ncbi:MAG: ISAs1 family transposase, partial [Sphingomonadales bacterium]|nr:ISAs1 family transposase [Sphingomonadales bacterium]
ALFEAVSAVATGNAPQDTASTRELARNRQEDRAVEVFTVGGALARTDWQPLIKTIVRVSRRTLIFNTATGEWKPRSEVAWYVSSASGLSASDWQIVIRGHWGIENRNHYVRDVSCGEDKSRIRTNPGIMARARSCALNILRHNSVPNVAKALWAGALNLDIVLNYKGI